MAALLIVSCDDKAKTNALKLDSISSQKTRSGYEVEEYVNDKILADRK